MLASLEMLDSEELEVVGNVSIVSDTTELVGVDTSDVDTTSTVTLDDEVAELDDELARQN